MKPAKPIAWRCRAAAERNPFRPGVLAGVNLFSPSAVRKLISPSTEPPPRRDA